MAIRPCRSPDRTPDDSDFVVPGLPTGRHFFDDTWARTGHTPRSIPAGLGSLGVRSAVREADFHLCAIGTHAEMLEFQRAVHERLAGRVQTFVQKSPRYLGTMCEVLRHDASKWAAVLHLAELWGVDPAEICAVGDDMNDVPMIAGAGLGVAMGHAPAAVLAAADLVTGDHD